MANQDIMLSVGSVFDPSGVMEGVRNLQATLQKQGGITLKSTNAAVDTGSAQKVLDTIAAQSLAIDSVIVKERTVLKANGDIVTGLVSMKVKWTDLHGAVVETEKAITSVASKLDKGDKVLTKDKYALTPGAELKTAQRELDGMIKSHDTLLGKAETYAVKSANWDAKKQIQLQGITALLREQVNTFDMLARAGDFKGAAVKHDEIQKTAQEMENLRVSTTSAAGAFSSLGSHMTNAIKQTIAYTFSIGLLRSAQQLLNKAIEFTVELNKEMINIQVLQAQGARSSGEIERLAKSYNKLAQEMGSTTVEIAKGSVEWLRQGNSIAQTTELLRSSTMLSKLGNLSSAESTEYLTSTINSFKIEAEDAIGVVDRLIAVDNSSATSTKELATALRYSAASAQQAGVSLEQLISYIGVISSTTRINAESIGQAMKTIFTRMQDIKAGKVDEDGLGLNNVETALTRVDIKLRDSQTEFRDMGVVLEELALKWEGLNEIEQANIGKAIAGVRQNSMFMVLMTNMSEALRLQEEQLNATGLATDRYNIYLRGVEAAQNKLKASLEALFQQAISSGMVRWWLGFATSILQAMKFLGGFNTVLIVTVATLALLNLPKIIAEVIKFSIEIKKLGENIKMVAEASKIGAGKGMLVDLFKGISKAQILAIVLALAAVAAVIYSIVKASHAIEGSIPAVNKFQDAIATNAEAIKRTEKLVERYNELNSIIRKTAEETSEFVSVNQELKELYPELNGYIDENGDYILTSAINMERLTAATLANQEANEIDLRNAAEKNASQKGKELGKAYDKMVKAQERSDRNPDSQALRDAATKASSAYLTLRDEMLDQYKLMGEDAAKEFMAGFTGGFLLQVDEFGKTVVATADSLKYELFQKLFVAGGGLPDFRDIYDRDPDKLKLPLTVDSDDVLVAMEEIQTKFDKFKDISEKVKAGDFTGIDQKDLDELGLGIEFVGDKLQFTGTSLATFKNGMAALISKIRQANPELATSTEELIKQAYAANMVRYNTEPLIGTLDAITAAQQQQNEEGYISIETANALVLANSSLADYLTASGDGFIFAGEGARDLAASELQATFASFGLGAAGYLAADGNIALAWSAVEASELLAKEKLQLYGLLKGFGALIDMASMPSVGGGGGGAKTEDPSKIAIEAKEAEIKSLEDKKKALQDELEQFKKYIAAQKEALRLAKEEQDFQEELARKSKDLAKLKARIAILSLDDSEEAMAQRLKLEEEASELEVEIAKDKTERTYDLQMEALDRVQKAFEDGIDKQMDAIEKMIAAIRALIEALRKAAEESGTSGGAALNTMKTTAEDTATAIADAMQKQYDLSEATKNALKEQILKWLAVGVSIGKAIELAKDYAEAINGPMGAVTYSPSDWSKVSKGEWEAKPVIYKEHTGGLIEKHHSGNFAGGLESNEVFAKLLKGEFVATEGQMDNFLSRTMPNIVSRAVGGNVNLSMPITVEGNMDESVLPSIEKIANKVIREINKTMVIRGSVRSANQTIS